ncbi:uncharacterized protein N7483_003699 [Penicillium malachiteum]|uniref:uncharacterized protein n=1 Tax=Penicillium malachiteum TaxID=1324776 RepID=UPI00254931A0|nr:uncharacterized protein N7483_003699 [Penicillium malachiteum]KAJ5729191.1 hypothetical protein N7483_003699 [Penicillium malachiteum]
MTKRIIHVPPLDSPSKQLMRDLCRDLDNVRIFNEDLKKVHAYERKVFFEHLDQIDQEREAIHTAALDEAEAFHNRVREEAEATLKEHNRIEEEERRRKEEESRLERERIEREKAEKLRREQEEAARLEAERQAKEEAKRKAEEEAERARQAALEKQRKEELEKLEKEQAEKRAKEEEAAKAKKAAEAKALAEHHQKTGSRHLSDKELKIHQRYLALHKTLKDFRAWIRQLGNEQPGFKTAAGLLRRQIRKSVGQLRDGKGANKTQIHQIRVDLEKAIALNGPLVDVRQFFAFPPDEIARSEQMAPALLIYGLHMLAKSLISVLVNEAAIKPQHAEPVGVLAAQIWSMDAFLYKGIALSDILWAKYRVVCPVLWGFTGSEETDVGRSAIGWWRIEAGGDFISEQEHLDRMTALGAGYAALTLRNFGKTKRRNPFPNTMFWHSMQKILAVPAAELHDTQITVLQAMLRYSGERIVTMWGVYGVGLVRRAVVGLPQSMTKKSMPVYQLELIKELYKRDHQILV